MVSKNWKKEEAIHVNINPGTEVSVITYSRKTKYFTEIFD